MSCSEETVEDKVVEEVLEEEECAAEPVGGQREVIMLARTLVDLRNEDVQTHEQEKTICQEWRRSISAQRDKQRYPTRHATRGAWEALTASNSKCEIVIALTELIQFYFYF